MVTVLAMRQSAVKGFSFVPSSLLNFVMRSLMHMVGLLLFTLNPKPEEDKPKEEDAICKYEHFVTTRKCFINYLIEFSLRMFPVAVFLHSLTPLNLSTCVITNLSQDFTCSLPLKCLLRIAEANPAQAFNKRPSCQ